MVEIQPPGGYNLTMIERNVLKNLMSAITDTPVILVTGARQTGKSTLVKHIHTVGIARQYLTMDTLSTFDAASSDPEGFISNLNYGPVIIDEIQKVPQLLLPIKIAVDTNRKPGYFILTGSANILMLPKVSESLTGRIEILTLYPFAQSELAVVKKSFPDILYKINNTSYLNEFMPVDILSISSSKHLMQMIIKGGYPEMQTRDSQSRQYAWFDSYITTFIKKDIKEFSNIENSTEIFRLLALLAAHTGSLSHYAELSRILEIPQTTLKRYIYVLCAAHLLQIIPAWSNNLGKRVVRSPKLMLNDTGLISYLLGINLDRLENDSILYGRLFECFVTLELLKHCSWSETNAKCYHFRTSTGQEVDIILEYPGGEIIGVEIKARATVSKNDFKWLKTLQESLGKRFLRGIVIYTGDQIIPFGDNLTAVPVCLLWGLK